MFDGEKGIKAKVTVNSLDMTTTGFPLNDLRAELLFASQICCLGQSILCSCPFQEIRERSPKERMACLAELSDEAILNLQAHCPLCKERHMWQNKNKVPLSQDDF